MVALVTITDIHSSQQVNTHTHPYVSFLRTGPHIYAISSTPKWQQYQVLNKHTDSMKLVLENRGKILQKEPEYLEKLLLEMIAYLLCIPVSSVTAEGSG